MNSFIKDLVDKIPTKTGVYQFYDNENKILYVGKAKNLRSRVSSYFNKNSGKKTLVLAKKIADIKYILVESEIDALFLENNLIKNAQPKYNVMLKDGKTYPWICITNEKVPKVFQTRIINKERGVYYGPYTTTYIVKLLLNIFSNIFYDNGWTPFSYINRTVNSKADLDSYLTIIEKIRSILKGNISGVISHLKSLMQCYSENLEFEKANTIKKQIDLLMKYQAKSTVVNHKINDVDVFSIVSDEKFAFVNYLKIQKGAIIQSHSLEIKKKLYEKDADLLLLAIVEIRGRFNSNSKTIYSSLALDSLWPNVKIHVPKIGDKKKLVTLSLKNAKYLKLEKINKKERTTNKNNRVLEKLKSDLKLKNIPFHIECFDNSNIQGESPVAACVVFKNGMPSKKEYRHYNIKTVKGIDDFKSMEEVVFRRYKRLLSENKNMPELIIIDGGKGQLNSAIKSLKLLSLYGEVPIIGIAKRLEEIYFPNDSIPLYLDKKSESLKLIQRLRNEAHRFGISHHRNKRLKKNMSISLEKIEGIGPKTIETLIKKFGSIKKIKEENQDVIRNLIGKCKTEKLFKSFLQGN